MGNWLRQSLTRTRLRAAFAKVRENNGQAGVDEVCVEIFAQNIEHNLTNLRTEVLNNQYQATALKRLWLSRVGKKPRPIAVPTVKDRTLQTAVAITLTPLLEAEFEECSYAYRQGRSVRMAVEHIEMLQRQGYKWVVEGDIEQFFDSIPHRKLLDELRHIAPDETLLQLIEQWLTAPIYEKDKPLQPNTIGVPQGSPISPLLANLYLDHLDEALLSKGHALVRYADDFVVLAKTKDSAEAAVELSSQVLHNLALKLNPIKTRVVSLDTGFEFLGWNFVRTLAVPANPKTAHTKSLDYKQASAISAADHNTLKQAATIEEDNALSLAFSQAFHESPHWQPNAENKKLDVDDCAIHKPTAPNTPEAQDKTTPIHETDTEPFAPHNTIAPPSVQRTLYIVNPAAKLTTENRHLVINQDDAILLSLPAINVDQVILFGRNAITTPALICCLQHHIPIAFLSRMGKYYGRLEPPNGQAVQLLNAQFNAHNTEVLDLAIAREIVRGKLSNSALVLARYARHRPDLNASTLRQSIQQLRELSRRARNATNLDSLRGFEGAGAAAYFQAWRVWLPAQWKFYKRTARSGLDPINALLDLGYTLLRQCIAGLIQARGLNPWLGHLHRKRAGHMALASDMMEEFRPLVVDVAILNTCLNAKIGLQDFIQSEQGFKLRPQTARQFIREIELHLNAEKRHPHSNERLDMRRIMDTQIRNLCSAYRHNDAASYRACIFR